jgi:hypothetical protein
MAPKLILITILGFLKRFDGQGAKLWAFVNTLQSSINMLWLRKWTKLDHLWEHPGNNGMVWGGGVTTHHIFYWLI